MSAPSPAPPARRPTYDDLWRLIVAERDLSETWCCAPGVSQSVVMHHRWRVACLEATARLIDRCASDDVIKRRLADLARLMSSDKAGVVG